MCVWVIVVITSKMFYEFFSSLRVSFGDSPLEKIQKTFILAHEVNIPAKMDFFLRFSSLSYTFFSSSQ